jgi:hypothetical protein
MADIEGPCNARAKVESFLRLHNRFWNQIGPEFDKPKGEGCVFEVTMASAGTLSAAVALAWVMREFGIEKADELAEHMRQYVENGEDYEGLFDDFEELGDTSLILVETTKES